RMSRVVSTSVVHRVDHPADTSADQHPRRGAARQPADACADHATIERLVEQAETIPAAATSARIPIVSSQATADGQANGDSLAALQSGLRDVEPHHGDDG